MATGFSWAQLSVGRCLGLGTDSEVKLQCPDLDIDAQRNARDSVPKSDRDARISIPMPNATPGPQFQSQIAMGDFRFRCPTQCPGHGSEVRSHYPGFGSEVRSQCPTSAFRYHIHRKAGESVPRPQCCSTHTEVRQQLILVELQLSNYSACRTTVRQS